MGVGGMFLDGGDAGALGLGVNVMAEVPGGMVNMRSGLITSSRMRIRLMN